MNIIDDKGRLFGKINIIDLLVVLLVIAVAGRFAVSRSRKPASVETKTIRAEFLVKDVREATSGRIKVGDTVREVKTNVVLGKITDVKAEPAQVFVNTADGRVVAATHPVLIDVHMTVEGSGTAGANAVVIGNSEIRIGTALVLTTNIYSVTSTVVGIEVL